MLFRSDYLHLGFLTLFSTGVVMQMAHALRGGGGGVRCRTSAIAMDRPNWIVIVLGRNIAAI